MERKKVSDNKKIEAVKKYKRGEGSQGILAREYGVCKASVQRWIAIYESMGPSGFNGEII